MPTLAKKASKRKTGRRKSASTQSYAKMREDFGLTRKILGRMTGLSERTLATWEAGRQVGEPALRSLKGVDRLLRALAEVVHRDVIASWLEKPNEQFSNLKPVEVMERGEADRLWRMIYFLGSGTLS
jgi:DNA-binding transcriptional regulator YiaG